MKNVLMYSVLIGAASTRVWQAPGLVANLANFLLYLFPLYCIVMGLAASLMSRIDPPAWEKVKAIAEKQKHFSIPVARLGTIACIFLIAMSGAYGLAAFWVIGFACSESVYYRALEDGK